MSDLRIVYNEFDLDKIGDEWESLVSAGLQIAEAHDRNRWTLGDLGCRVARRYGENSLGSYADAVNVRPTTMYDYAACSRAYSVEDRAAFPPLTWSHFRAALRAGDTAMLWLARAADEGWKVDELAEALRVAEGEKPRPRKLLEVGGEFQGCVDVRDDDGQLIGVVLQFRCLPEVLDSLDKVDAANKVVTLKVYGVPLAVDEDVAEAAHG